MPLHLVVRQLAEGQSIRLPIDDPAILPGARPIYAVHQRSRLLATGARSLLQQLQSGRYD